MFGFAGEFQMIQGSLILSKQVFPSRFLKVFEDSSLSIE